MTQMIYLLEDEPEIARIVMRELEVHGLPARHFGRLSDFRREVARHRPSLCLVDLTLPDGDGVEIVSDILRREAIPTIIVTGRGTVHDRVVGLELGADDYILKPFEPRELVARVRALLRRSNTAPKQATSQRVRFEGYLVDFDACELFDSKGQIQQLSLAESRLLKAFVEAPGRILSRAQLLDLEAPNDMDPEDRSMDARISRLRRKLGDNPRSPKLIRTVYGAGYIFSTNPDWE